MFVAKYFLFRSEWTLFVAWKCLPVTYQDFLIWSDFYSSPDNRGRKGDCNVWPSWSRRWRRTGRARVHQVSLFSFNPHSFLSPLSHIFLPPSSYLVIIFLDSNFSLVCLFLKSSIILPLPPPLLPLPSQGLSERSWLCSNPERSGSRSRGDGGWVGGIGQSTLSAKKIKKCAWWKFFCIRCIYLQ